MSLTSKFATNTDKEEKGVPILYPANEDGSIPTFYVARMGRTSKSYMKALERAMRPFKRQMELKTLDNDTAGDAIRDVFITTILKGWDNVLMCDVTGNVEDKGFSPFNQANARMLMDRLPDIYDDLNTQASDAANFRDANLEEDAKN